MSILTFMAVGSGAEGSGQALHDTRASTTAWHQLGSAMICTPRIRVSTRKKALKLLKWPPRLAAVGTGPFLHPPKACISRKGCPWGPQPWETSFLTPSFVKPWDESRAGTQLVFVLQCPFFFPLSFRINKSVLVSSLSPVFLPVLFTACPLWHNCRCCTEGG